METLQAGFGLADTSPLVGTPLAGYIRVRYASGVRDPLFARALALSDGATSVLVIACDVLAMAAEDVAAARAKIAARLPVKPENVWFFSTHAHTAPALVPCFETPRSDEYAARLPNLVLLAADTAWHDLAPATPSFARADVPGVAFERRYRMKDGTIRTNPGVGNPEIVEPERQIRTPLSLLAFERDPTRLPIVLASFPCHADVVGGTDASADYPGRTCNELTHRLPGHPETLFLLGACGDVNHIDVNASEAAGGYDHAVRMARRLGEAAVAAWPERIPVAGALDIRRTTVALPRRPVDPAALKEARTIVTREQAFGKQLTTEGIWARELVLLAEMPETMAREVAVLAIGDVAIVALHGEVFTALSDRIADASPFAHTVVAELYDDGEAYVLPEGDYGQQGYEERPARSSPYAPGAGERLVEAALGLFRR